MENTFIIEILETLCHLIEHGNSMILLDAALPKSGLNISK